jgi:hypothetical protein
MERYVQESILWISFGRIFRPEFTAEILKWDLLTVLAVFLTIFLFYETFGRTSLENRLQELYNPTIMSYKAGAV